MASRGPVKTPPTADDDENEGDARQPLLPVVLHVIDIALGDAVVDDVRVQVGQVQVPDCRTRTRTTTIETSRR